MPDGQWFIITGGPDEGRPHMAGWSLTARRCVPMGGRNDEYLDLATCPRCAALVMSPSPTDAISREVRAHEQWHASTDHPIPVTVQRVAP